MLRPNYENTFAKITSKILANEAEDTNNFVDGRNKSNNLLSFYPFVSLSIIDSLLSSDTDTAQMNTNLDFLLTQWQY